ncbi:MAG: hypothetical protein HKO87_09225 [Acidimicrobiia bacterium]|nr:hypothetical protein [Acidimicrobiia bacterium]
MAGEAANPIDVTELCHQVTRIAPVVLAAEQVLPVPELFGELLPGRGLQRGWITRVEGGPSARAFAWALLAGVTTSGGWIAAVDVPGIGLAAARDVGVAIERIVVVSSPDAGEWSTVVAALIGAVDVVVFDSPRHRVAPSEHRRLASRARERGSVLLELATSSRPVRLESQLQYDLAFSTRPLAWEGLGNGHGCLRGRALDVAVSGRRLGGASRSARFELPGVDGTIRRIETAESAVVIPLR